MFSFESLILCLSDAMNAEGLKKQSPNMVLKKPKPKKITQKRLSVNTRSNILKKIIEVLENGKCQHMLYWVNRQERIFAVKFVHMNSKEFKKADYLLLFKYLDKLSNKFEEYMRDKKYDHKCKVRCKSNLNKLCGKALTLMEEINDRSIKLRKYKLNDESLLGVSNLSEEGNLIKLCNVIVTQPDMSAGNSNICGVESCSSIEKNDKSESMECSELFDLNTQVSTPIHNIVRQLDMSVGNAGFYGVGSCSSIEKNDKSKLIEYNKWFDPNIQENMAIPIIGIHPDMSAGNSNFCVVGSCSSIEKKDKCESMEECGKLLSPGIQGSEEVMNLVSLSTMSAGNSNFCGVGSCSSIEKNDKFESLECSELFDLDIQDSMASHSIVNQPIMSAGNSDYYGVGSCSTIEKNDKSTLIEYNKLFDPNKQESMAIHNIGIHPDMSAGNSNFYGVGSCSSIEKKDKCESMEECGKLLSPGIQGNEAVLNMDKFQDLDVDIKKWSQMVPSFPDYLRGDFNDSLSKNYMGDEFCRKNSMDELYRHKLLSSDDPFLSSTISNNPSISLSVGNYNLPPVSEDPFSVSDDYFSSSHDGL